MGAVWSPLEIMDHRLLGKFLLSRFAIHLLYGQPVNWS
jgi:hypothetical protein